MMSGKTLVLVLLGAFIMTAGFGCKWNPFANSEIFEPIVLEYWGVWDTPQDLSALIESYQTSHPTIKVRYRSLRFEEYEQKLLEAWADDRGPDIFAIPSTWLKEYQHRLEPMPSSVTVPVQTIKGSIKKELITEAIEFKGLSSRDIKTQYVPIVFEDIVKDGDILALPYSLDTLVTFYNADLLDDAAIPEPIEDFHDLVEQVPELTKASENSRIFQSGVGLGGTDNIPRFFDIFSSIMMQNGVDLKGKSFQPSIDEESNERLNQAFEFYADFARPGRATYSWSDDLDDAFEMFASGKLAYFFGYSYHAAALRERGLPFNWDVANFPQTRGAEGTKYYGDYWVNAVSKKSQYTDAAWNFIQSTAQKSVVNIYLKENKRPTALRSLIDEQLGDDDLRVFASQVLTADNWYNGYNVDLAEVYMKEAINDIIAGREGDHVGLFVQKINQTYLPPNE